MTRFERKILIAMLVVALGPLIGALVVGPNALRDAYHRGVNPEVRRGLEQGLEGRRAQLVALRELADQTVAAIANDWRLRHALRRIASDGSSFDVGDTGDVEQSAGFETQIQLQSFAADVLTRFENVSRIAVVYDGELLAEAVNASRRDETLFRILEREHFLELENIAVTLRVDFAASKAPFKAYERAGEIAEVLTRLEERSAYVSTTYVVVYLGALGLLMCVTLVLGLLLSRRVTRRVAAVAMATRQVGAGDMSVRVPTSADDEIGELTEAFNQMVRDLQASRHRIDYLQRISAWQEFARRLAHEIKNPLTPIQLASQEIMRRYQGADDVYQKKLVEATGIIEEEVATLRRLVSEFSNFAKLPRVHLEEADLVEFVEDMAHVFPAILEDVRRASDANDAGDASVHVQLRCQTSSERIPVRMDAMMLKRCVENLLRNAVQALAEYSGDTEDNTAARKEVRLEAHREETGPWCTLVVSDNGPGIALAAREAIFDPYHTTKPSGTGLGLAIVKKIVLEHDGEILCDEAPQKGARFTIRLPLV